ncbi:helix-turn-helix transcriptional regulator [Metapseudomonas lalkuanensis]|uniref:Helix-turn-helix transcriptional regulator n=1 Tax=Metapseudomonas lalkuanensis TaxID=2604832 RepID=A0A5J6QIQ8_9GAMM|nr:LuxR C-terminal-related transcriptional regulator [Pseudomonas lalkuanensis]QEY62618.1 helix-turn-helix transcriptional regulator [Pseudomonas lalkuanensis]
MPSKHFLRLPPGHLPRPRLHDALLQGDCRLRLLCASAGYGKTVLLGECLQQIPADTRLAYLDLRGEALSPTDFTRRLSAALGQETADIVALRQQLQQEREPVWLVLDDYSRFPAVELDRLLNELIQLGSRQLQWWIASRRRPQLQLARMLLDGDLFELGSNELAFSTAETAELLQRAELGAALPSPKDLHQEMQGWCAGTLLRMLGLKAGPQQAAELYRSLLQDYLRHELLDPLPEDWQQALFTLAHFPHFDQALCEQLFGSGEGGRLLAQLRECGLFIEAPGDDERALRILPAIAPRLAALLPAGTSRTLYRRACQWYMSQDDVRPALEYALKAEQPEVAASLMQHYTRDRLLHGRSLALLMQWRAELPDNLLESTPRLVLLNAWALMLCGRLDEAQQLTDNLARFLPQPDPRRQRGLLAQWKALAGNLAFHRGQAALAAPLLEEAIAELPRSAWAQRLFCSTLQIELALIEGRLDEAQELNRAAIKEAREHASPAMEAVLAMGHVKLLELRGELLRAETLLKRVHTELTSAWGAEPSPMRGRVQLRRAAILLQQGRYQESEEAYKSGAQESQACADAAAFWGLLGQAELDALQDDLASAFSRITEVERIMQYGRISAPMYQGLVVRAKARIWLRQGRSSHAEKALLALPAEAFEMSPYGMPDLHLRLRLLLAQARLANGAVDDALTQLEAMLERAKAEGRRPLACEIGFSLAEGLYADNRQARARQVLLDALALARQMGLASVERAFALRNPAMMRWAGESAGGSSGASASLLSRRELEVLRLIVRGHSNQQIAESLFISLHTVKTHAQKINCKLGVERRTQAIARAKELGLAG